MDGSELICEHPLSAITYAYAPEYVLNGRV